MTVATFSRSTDAEPTAVRSRSARFARTLVAAVMIAAGVGGFMATDATAAARAIAAAGPDLTRLMRAMAAIKAVIGAGAAAALFWRLSLPVSAPRLALYAAGGAAMAAGPALIWNIADLGAGTLLLHAGLGMTVIMLWRDREVVRGLSRLVADRRAARKESISGRTGWRRD